MSTVLRQRNMFVTKVFEITTKSLKVKNSNLFESIEHDFSFEEMTEKIVNKRFISIPLVCITIVFALLSFKEFISIYNSDKPTIPLDYLAAYLFITIVLVAITFLKKTEITYLVLTNGIRIELYSDKPSKIIVNDFLAVLQVEKSTYLTKKIV